MLFLGSAVFLDAVVITAAGFAVVYFSHKVKSGWLSASAWILIVGGALSIACFAYHTVRYQAFGHWGRGGNSCSMMRMGGNSDGMEAPDSQAMEGMMRTMDGMQDRMAGLMKSKGMMDSKEMKGMMKDMDGMRDTMKGMMGSTGPQGMMGMGTMDDDSTDHTGHHH